jgi:hypothetical protein
MTVHNPRKDLGDAVVHVAVTPARRISISTSSYDPPKLQLLTVYSFSSSALSPPLSVSIALHCAIHLDLSQFETPKTMSKVYHLAGASDSAIDVDPQNPGTVVRAELALESIANVPFAILALFYPRSILSHLMVAPTSTITPAAEGLLQFIGTATVMVSVLLALAWPNTRSGMDLRRPIYLGVVAGELGMLVIFAGWLVRGEELSGFTRDGAVMSLLAMGPLALFRLFVIVVKPEWFGKYAVKEKAKAK